MEQLQEWIPFKDVINNNVSGAPVGWHISHCLKVCTAVFDALAAADPAAYKKEFSLPRKIVLLSGYIPRGKAGAPEKVLPEKGTSSDYLKIQIFEARHKLRNFHELASGLYLEHPYFRKVSREQTPRF